MKNKILTLALVLALIISVFQIAAFAAVYTPPTSYGAPQNIGVTFNGDDIADGGRWSFEITINASNEVRSLLQAEVGDENSPFQTSGYNSLGCAVQWDYKIDNGAWRSAQAGYEDWVPEQGTDFSASTGYWASTVDIADYDFDEIFPNSVLPGGKTYFNTHTISFRVRFEVTFGQDDTGENFQYYSPWSEIVTYNNNQVKADPAALLNHTPKLISVEPKTYGDGTPYLAFTADKAHTDTQQLNSLSNGRVYTNIWIRADGGAWKDWGSYLWMKEKFDLDASAYFDTDSFDSAVYEVKFRYEFDYDYYTVAGKSGQIYSPFSNTISHGIPAFSKASTWAIDYLNDADELGIMTDRLRG